MNFRMFDSIPGLYPGVVTTRNVFRLLPNVPWGSGGEDTPSSRQSQQMTSLSLLCADVGKQRLMVTKLVPGSVGF